MRFTIFIIFALIIFPMKSQELEKHQWNDRILLILNAEDDQQLSEFLSDTNGLKERKLVNYDLKPGKARLVFPEKTAFRESALFKKYAENKNFEVVLIGLDGGVKLRQTEILENEELFAVIDGMPMRKAEIRSKNGKQ